MTADETTPTTGTAIKVRSVDTAAMFRNMRIWAQNAIPEARTPVEHHPHKLRCPVDCRYPVHDKADYHQRDSRTSQLPWNGLQSCDGPTMASNVDSCSGVGDGGEDQQGMAESDPGLAPGEPPRLEENNDTSDPEGKTGRPSAGHPLAQECRGDRRRPQRGSPDHDRRATSGTNVNAVKTNMNTAARRKTARDAIIGRSRRGETLMFPLIAPTAITTTEAPITRKAPIQIGVIDLIPLAMIGQLRPSTRTTVANNT